MALIACPECGQKVSSTAPACPGCGHAVAQALKYKSRQQGCAAVALVVGAVLVIAFIAGDKTKPGDSAKPAAAADPTPLIGQTWYAKGTPIGCRDSKDIDRLGELARQNDKEAFARFYMRQSLAGQCTHLDEGVAVYVENISILGPPCVRPKGDPFCLYVMRSMLQNAPAR